MVSPKAKKFIFGGAIFGMLFGAPSCDRDSDENSDKKSNKTEMLANINKDKPDVNNKYKIETRADFDALYNAAEPFIFAAMIPTENWREDFHNDRQKANATPNSVGVGLYYVGVKDNNLDFSSKKWKKTKTYVINYQNSHNGKNPPNLKPYQLYEGTRGWFKDMDAGRHLNELFNHLKGARLSIHEFAAIASIYYNDEVIGKDVCDYVVKNYQKPKKCAQYIIGTATKMNGIKPRRVHEVLIYLNHDNYCSNVFDLEVDGYLSTSVSGLRRQYNELRNGITEANLDSAANAIYNRVVKNGRPIRYYVKKLNSEQQDAVLAFAGRTAKSIEMEKRGKLYELALEKYGAEDYAIALKLFQKIVAENGNSADLYNDIAITYYHLGMYDECIAQSQKVLETDETGEYMFAKYHIGLAQWALKNYDSAIKSFNEAIGYAKDFGDAERQKVYESKLNKCKKERDAAKTTSAKNAKKVTAKKQNTAKNNLKKGTQKIHAMTQLDKQHRMPGPLKGKQYA